MSFLGNIVKGVVHDVTKAASDVVNGAGKALSGLGETAKGLVGGNPKEALKGVGDLAKGGVESLDGAKTLAEDLTPEGAATTVALAGGKAAIESMTSGSGETNTATA